MWLYLVNREKSGDHYLRLYLYNNIERDNTLKNLWTTHEVVTATMQALENGLQTMPKALSVFSYVKRPLARRRRYQ